MPLLGTSTARVCFQIADEILHVARDLVGVGATETDVQEIVLAKDPSVAAHVGTKEEFGEIADNSRTGGFRTGHLKFDLLGYYGGW